MNATTQTPAAAVAPPTGRLWAGVAVFAAGWIIGLGLVPFVTRSDLTPSIKATLTTLLVVVIPKLFLVGAIAILGKPGFAYLKSVVFGFFKKAAPPAEVGPWRYRVGLVMFLSPFFLGLVITYFGPVLPGGAEKTAGYEKISDVLQIASLFVLGGDFWDKLRALFVRNAKAVFPPKAATAG
ncbi:MAG TPA: hypothetical protein VFS58_03845 [Steroidobacteraceae bacterium]|nr:hypothetical protein [Steroidobacteraceae bacterium]